MLNNLIMERQFLPSAAELTNGFPCRKFYEKKDTIIDMREKDIEQLKSEITKLNAQKERLEVQFQEYVYKVKESKKGVSREQKEIENSLRKDIESLKIQLKTSHRMNELLARQNKHGNR